MLKSYWILINSNLSVAHSCDSHDIHSLFYEKNLTVNLVDTLYFKENSNFILEGHEFIVGLIFLLAETVLLCMVMHKKNVK